MSKASPLKARLPRGFADRPAGDLAGMRSMLDTIARTFELYGFEALETPFVEYTDALGKFLPDLDRPNEGVFSFQDDDEQWLSLRYDLTAPLARHVAAGLDDQSLSLPYRSYRSGWVFRNEKPGPGRFRQFMQFDADTVGSASVAADAEACMLMADTLEAVGIPRGQYLVKVNNRKVLDGVLEAIGLGGEENAARRLIVLRALDKVDRLGIEGVTSLLGRGRHDESGDYTRGASLSSNEIDRVLAFVAAGDKELSRVRFERLLEASALGPDEVRGLLTENDRQSRRRVVQRAKLSMKQLKELFLFMGGPLGFGQVGHERRPARSDDLHYDIKFGPVTHRLMIDNLETVKRLRRSLPADVNIRNGLDELEQIATATDAAGYGSARVLIDPSVVRGLEYYTGPVYEAELLFPVVNDEGQTVRFGSVAGGGRYDGLVGRFRPEPVPATGFSIGVSRLFAALQIVGSPIVARGDAAGPVVVLVMDRDRPADYQRLVARLRGEGIRAEMYLGSAGMKAQMKYADRRRAPCVVIQGSQERERGEVQIKDLREGAERAATEAGAASNAEYRSARLAQVSVPESAMVDEVRKVLARHGR